MQLEVLSFPDNLLSSSMHVIYDPETRDGLLIDAGCLDAQPVVTSIEQQDIRISHILLTHEHFDHIWSVNDLSRHFGATCIAHEICAASASDPVRNLSRYTPHGECTATVHHAPGGKFFQFQWNKHTVSIQQTPGHSPGSVCFSIENLLVTGDTIISNAATVTKLPGGNRLDLAASLLVLCAGISFPVTVLPGHGMPWAAHSLGSFRCCTGSKTPALAT